MLRYTYIAICFETKFVGNVKYINIFMYNIDNSPFFHD